MINKKTFFNGVTTTGSAVMDNINLGSQLVLEVSGTATSITATVEGIVGDYNADQWTTLSVIPLRDFEVSDIITGNGIYTVGVDGIVHIRVSIASISGGNATIVGKLCN